MIYITGTDTGIGKTYITRLLLEDWNNQHLKTIGLKPVASGCEWIDGQYINRDASILQKAASMRLAYTQVNPFCLKLPVAPHIAASKEKRELTIKDICIQIQKLAKFKYDKMIIEGIGGLIVPLNKRETQLDLIKALKCPVVVVIGLKLGCLNHALLTLATLKTYQIPINGWVINHIDPHTLCARENIETLKHYFREILYIGYVPFLGQRIIHPA